MCSDIKHAMRRGNKTTNTSAKKTKENRTIRNGIEPSQKHAYKKIEGFLMVTLPQKNLTTDDLNQKLLL